MCLSEHLPLQPQEGILVKFAAKSHCLMMLGGDIYRATSMLIQQIQEHGVVSWPLPPPEEAFDEQSENQEYGRVCRRQRDLPSDAFQVLQRPHQRA